jgi:hypothetical protein
LDPLTALKPSIAAMPHTKKSTWDVFIFRMLAEHTMKETNAALPRVLSVIWKIALFERSTLNSYERRLVADFSVRE